MKRIAFFFVGLMMFSLGFGSAEAKEWKFDMAHSIIKFSARHMMVSDVWGTFDSFEGQVQFDPEKPLETRVTVTVDANSLNTKNERRDGHLRSADFFEVETYPTLRFVSKRVEKSANGYLLIGDLTMRDVTKEITLKVATPSGPLDLGKIEKVGISAHGKLNRTDWGLNWNRAIEAGGVVVSEEITMVIEAELDREK